MAFAYNAKIKEFSLLDATSTNITGGQPIKTDQLLHVMGKNWTVSSFLTEVNNGFDHSYVEFRPNNFVYMYSFGSDPIDSATTGASHNTHRFTGNEQLQIYWDEWITEDIAYQIDVYAYVQSVIECTATYVKKGIVNN